jgi:acetoacetate decarboxylase
VRWSNVSRVSEGTPPEFGSASALFPPAPWQLRGWGIGTVQGVDVRAARRVVPADCAIVTVAPGKTLGGLLFVSYESGSTVVYRELAVVAALVRVGRRVAFYLPRLYVDSAASLTGGRAIWGVPKDMASFEVAASRTQRTIVVRCAGSDVCRLQAAVARGGVRLTVPMPTLGTRAASFLFFTSRLTARVSFIRAAVELPPDGEFAGLSLDRPWFAVSLDGFNLMVPVPITVSRRRFAPVSVVAPSLRRTANPSRRLGKHAW